MTNGESQPQKQGKKKRLLVPLLIGGAVAITAIALSSKSAKAQSCQEDRDCGTDKICSNQVCVNEFQFAERDLPFFAIPCLQEDNDLIFPCPQGNFAGKESLYNLDCLQRGNFDNYTAGMIFFINQNTGARMRLPSFNECISSVDISYSNGWSSREKSIIIRNFNGQLDLNIVGVGTYSLIGIFFNSNNIPSFAIKITDLTRQLPGNVAFNGQLTKDEANQYITQFYSDL